MEDSSSSMEGANEKMKTIKFKQGDMLRCIEPRKVRSGTNGDNTFPKGTGWELDFEFEVTRTTNDDSLDSYPIYWGGKEDQGVYECSVELANTYPAETGMALAIREAVNMLKGEE